MSTRILIGDCRDMLRTLPDESVHCVVTSPPYWGLRDYGVSGQLGLERSLGEHIAVMVDVFREVRRVLRKDGTLWLNYGDCYATSPNGRKAADIVGDDRTFRDKPFSTIGPIYDPSYELTSRVGKTQNNNHTAAAHGGRVMAGGTLKPKDLCGVPWRVAFALQDDGWWLRQDIIWSKPNPMPESIKDRCTKAHEYLFLLAKSERYYFDQEAIKEPASDIGRENGRDGRDEDSRARPPGSNPRTLARLDYTQPRVRRIKVPGGWDRADGAHGTIHRDGRTSAEYQDVEVSSGRNKRSVWTIPTNAFPDAHFATFPPALIEPCIKAGCPVDGTVLDPFGGSGTTAMVADRLQRDAILIELNPDYAAMAERRIKGDGGMFCNLQTETATPIAAE